MNKVQVDAELNARILLTLKDTKRAVDQGWYKTAETRLKLAVELIENRLNSDANRKAKAKVS